MDENKVLEEREKKLIRFLKSDKLFTIFLIISLLSLIFSGLVKAGVTLLISFFSAGIWLSLFIFSAISCILIFFKKRKFAFYPLLAWVTWLAVYIRTLNLPGLRDVTTGGWTLGPDLDPFLFLRWAKYIIIHGSLMVHDAMRYVPLGFDTATELGFLSYLIAWFHKIAVLFGSSSVEQSAALFPVFMFALTVIAFFLFVRKLFVANLGETKSNIIALIASFFLSTIPSFIPRTVAGIPEKESAAFVFLFLAFYFFISSWKSEKAYSRILLGILAGAATSGMALIWGGYIFSFITIALAAFLSFIFGQIDKNKFYVYSIWLISSIAFTMPFTERYSIFGWITSPSTGISFAVFGIMAVHLLIYNTKIKDYFSTSFLLKIPKQIISIIVTLILGIILLSIISGPAFIFGAVKDIIGHLVAPVVDRLGITVAENRQPYFDEWAYNFGPMIKGIPLTFWLFFVGSIFLFWNMIKFLKKNERIMLTISYLIFLICIIFSRYSSSSILNGINSTSLFVYALGFIALIGCFGYYYFRYYKKGEESKLQEIEFNLLMVFSFFFLCIVAARGAVRLIMMLVPPASIIISYFAVSTFAKLKKAKDGTFKVIAYLFIILIVLSIVIAGYQFYQGAESTARSYVPSMYNQQWQKAMSWVRENTQENAVFGHWWDYGYWLQSIGERATVLDGGNTIPYWDHLMGRYALTGKSDNESLEFLYTHNTTHFLIDSSDIGKYPAFSSIGADENYDRYSWIHTFLNDPRQTQESKNSTLLVYTGGFPLDSDIVYEDKGEKIFLPELKAGLGAIILEINTQKEIASNPIGVFFYQNKQIKIPLRYAFDSSSQKLLDFNSGLDAGIFVFPALSQNSEQGVLINEKGALLYLSSRTVKSQLARLYLYKEDNQFFELVHSEDDFIVAQLKENNATASDIIYYDGLRGPIRIWEIHYPDWIRANPIYLEKNYPDIRLSQATR